MKIRTFRAPSIQEALQLVREKLGGDATILHIRELKPKRRFGRSGEKYFEIDASNEVQVASRFPVHENGLGEDGSSSKKWASEQARAAAADKHESDIAALNQIIDQPSDASLELYPPRQQDTNTPQSVKCESTEPTGKTDSHPLYKRLLENGFNARDASELIIQSEDPSSAHSSDSAPESSSDRQLSDSNALMSCLAERLQATPGLLDGSTATRSVALIGPPGAGKTETLMKLASDAVQRLEKSVSLVTFDNFRRGAVDQLLYFAEQLETPLEVIDDAARVSAAMSRLAEYDLVLIDTPGIPARSATSLSALDSLLHAAKPDALCLVLDACRSTRCVQDCLMGFQSLEPTHLIVTKLDEAVEFGSWYSTLRSTSLPVSYVTTGQSIANNVTEASPSLLARLLLGSQNVSELATRKSKRVA